MAIWTHSNGNWNWGATANFRQTGRLIGESLVACGFVRTADTGQINWDTVQITANLNTAFGYEIFRFNDPMQATNPVFFKIEYGSGSSSPKPGVWWTFGSGSDGAGNLTGRVGPRFIRNLMVDPTNAASYASRASGDGTYWTASFGENASGVAASAVPTFVFALERARNADGSVSSAGVAFYYRPLEARTATAPHGTSYTFNSSGTVHNSPGYGIHFVTWPYAVTSLSQPNGDIGLYPALSFMPQVRPLTCMVGYVNADLPQYTQFQASVLGATRTYFTTGDGGIQNGSTTQTTNVAQVVTSVALRYE